MKVKVVIACAGSKDPDAGRLRTPSGEKVIFVADPKSYESKRSDDLPLRPDDRWCDATKRYNERYKENGANPDNLYRAADLYKPKIYLRLVDAFGWKNIFLLSGGWGLIPANFLTPYYESTFSTSQAIKKSAFRDGSVETWPNFNYLQSAQTMQDETIHFFGGFDYLKVYCCLMKRLPGIKVVHYNSVKVDPERLRRDGFVPENYARPEARQNWYYKAAKDFADGHSSGAKEVD